MAAKLSWKFPDKKTAFLRIEIFFLVLLAILIFLYTSFQFERQVFLAIALTLLFLIIYVLVAYVTKHKRNVQEKYHVVGPHLHITRKVRKQTNKEKVHLKHVVHHKLDKIFLGGYLVTKKGEKHVLFFNNREEMDKFEKNLNKHMKLAKG